jgi:hypothetical protein
MYLRMVQAFQALGNLKNKMFGDSAVLTSTFPLNLQASSYWYFTRSGQELGSEISIRPRFLTM